MKLEEDNRNTFYTVPDGYFEKLPTEIQEKLEKPHTEHYNLRGVALKIAFACLLFIPLTYYLLPFSTREEPDIKVELLENFTNEDLLNYISQTEYNATELLEIALNDDNIDELLVSPSLVEEYQLQETLLEDMIWNKTDE